MAETAEEKAAREAKEATEKAEKEKKEEEKRIAKEAAEKEEEEKRKRTPQNKDPHDKSADVTKTFLGEWDVFKKRNPNLFIEPSTDPPPTTKKPHSETCIFGFLCPFPDAEH